jgi:PAS domain S-box-containing protein
MSHHLSASQQTADLALRVADSVPAMLAYWNADQICLFANDAFRAWFGKGRGEVVGTSMRELLGPIYPLNLPHILAALRGETQVFERTIPRPDGNGVRESLATYTPDIVEGVVRGFFVHVADVTPMKALQRELQTALQQVRTLEGLLPICMHCKNIRDADGAWTPVEAYLRARTEAKFSHGLCPQCLAEHYPDVDPEPR